MLQHPTLVGPLNEAVGALVRPLSPANAEGHGKQAQPRQGQVGVTSTGRSCTDCPYHRMSAITPDHLSEHLRSRRRP